jgi:hypothetical protein
MNATVPSVAELDLLELEDALKKHLEKLSQR